MKKKFWKRFWIVVWIIYGIFEIGYHVLQPVLTRYGLEYRQYVQFLALEVLWLVPLFFGLFGIVCANYHSMMRKKRAGWSGSGIAIFVLYLLFLLVAEIALVVFDSWTGKKETVQDHVIVVTDSHGIARAGVEDYYCDPVGPFLRKPFTWDGEREQKLLEDHYNMKFTFVAGESGERSYIPEDYPDIQVHITVQIPLQDDFTDQLTTYLFAKEYQEKHLLTKAFLGNQNDPTSSLANGNTFYLIADSEDALEQCGKDAAALIKEVLKEPYFKNHRGYLICRIQYEDDYENVRLPFGTDTTTYGTSLTGRLFGIHSQIDGEDVAKPDYYAESVNVWPKLSTTWEGLKDRTVYKNTEMYDGSSVNETDGNEDSRTSSDTENDTDQEYQNIEDAAKILYINLNGSEDGFAVSYNAKGMPYVILKESERTQDGKTVITRQTLKYDRISQNGKCYLFSYEEDETDSNGNASSDTKMLNYYAVDLQNNMVTASGKHAYSDTGSAAYQEAAGEP